MASGTVAVCARCSTLARCHRAYLHRRGRAYRLPWCSLCVALRRVGYHPARDNQ